MCIPPRLDRSALAAIVTATATLTHGATTITHSAAIITPGFAATIVTIVTAAIFTAAIWHLRQFR